MAAHSAPAASLAVPADQPLSGWDAWLRDIARSVNLLAPAESPVFTGDPQAPTPTPGDNDNSIATTEFVTDAIAAGLDDYLPLAGGTLTGPLGIGGAPTRQLHISGTYTTADGVLSEIGGTLASNSTLTLVGLAMIPTLQPAGATLNGITNLNSLPTLNSTTLTVGTFQSINSNLTLGAGFTGTITLGRLFNAGNPANTSGKAITTLIQYAAGALTNGTGLTTGTVINQQFRAQGITAGAAGGTVNNRGLDVTMPSGTAPASGTVNNRGIYITGNGGAAPGGTGIVNNFCLFSDSTAPASFAGTVRTGGYTVATLPAAGTVGRLAYVTDALAPAYLVPVAGGGAVVTPVFDNGAAWVAH